MDGDRLFITTNACTRFIQCFGQGTETARSAKIIIGAMLARSMEVSKTKQKNPRCLVSRDTRTGRRVFFVVQRDAKVPNRQVVTTTLTQEKACNSFGFIYEKEESD